MERPPGGPGRGPLTGRHLLATFVFFHGIAVVVLSIPPPPPGLRSANGGSKSAIDQQVGAWAEAASSLGIPPERFVPAVARFAQAQSQILSAVQPPFRVYAQATGAGQSWRMFGAVPRRGARLEIEVREQGRWRPLFVGRSDDAAWHRTLFDQERMRAFVHQFTRRQARGAYDALFGWVVTRVEAEFPDTDGVRMQMRELHIPDPDRLAETGVLDVGAPYWVRTHPRAP